MNNKGVNPTLTTILIAGLVGLTVIVLAFNSYNQFMVDNSGSIDGDYISYYQNISAQNDELTSLSNDISDQEGILGDIFSGAGTAVNVFIVGLKAIGSFFKIIPILNSVINTIEYAVPGFTTLLGLFIVIGTLYVAMRYIQSARGNTQAP